MCRLWAGETGAGAEGGAGHARRRKLVKRRVAAGKSRVGRQVRLAMRLCATRRSGLGVTAELPPLKSAPADEDVQQREWRRRLCESAEQALRALSKSSGTQPAQSGRRGEAVEAKEWTSPPRRLVEVGKGSQRAPYDCADQRNLRIQLRKSYKSV